MFQLPLSFRLGWAMEALMREHGGGYATMAWSGSFHLKITSLSNSLSHLQMTGSCVDDCRLGIGFWLDWDQLQANRLAFK